MIRMMKKIGNGLGAVIGVLSVVLAAALVGVRLVGLRPFVVLSGSMEPTYPVGSLIYVKQVDYKTLSVGDAITFMMDENTVVTHRIIEILPDETEPDTLRFITRGDANDAPDGGAEKFIFAPGTRQSPTSLFEDFLDMMPGDERTERIEIRSARRSGEAVRVYMRLLGAQEGTDDFLAQFTLTVRPAEDSLLFEAPANETAQLSDWVCLGTIQPGGNIPLDVTLAMPITAGSEWQSQTGYIDWQFKIERIPAATGTVRTGDAAHPALYLGAVSLAALGVVLTRRKGKN